MEEIIINGKALYTPKGAAREYAAVGCNFFTGCPHNCEYCYLKRGAPSKQLGGTEVKLKKCFKSEVHAREILEKELDANLEHLQKVGIFLSFTTDPLIKETRSLTCAAILCALCRDIPVMVLTKNADFIEDREFMDLMENILVTSRHMVAFGFTLTGRDDMEPGASTNFDRIRAMSCLYRKGFKTWASIEPVIDWQSAKMVVTMSMSCCDHYKIGLRSGVKKDYYDLIASGYALDHITNDIIINGRTVYLKKSARDILARCYKQEYLDKILVRSVDENYNIFV